MVQILANIPDLLKIGSDRLTLEILSFAWRKARENTVTAVVRIGRQRRII